MKQRFLASTIFLSALFCAGCAQAAPEAALPNAAPAPASAPPAIASAFPGTAPHPGRLQNIVFPDDANIINVKEAPYNAKGDGVTDDTAAIQSAYNRTGLIYFPNGTYLVSGHIEPPKRKGKVPSRRILQGQSTAGTIIKLKDNATGFGDPAKEVSVFKVSYAPEQAFRNGVRNLTIDTGKGNPGAIAMQFYASNQGGMHHVHIRSGDGQGKIGLDLNFSGENGPLLIKDISVDGFDVGIDGGSGHLITLDHIRVENQNKIGFYSQSYGFIHDFRSVQTKPIPAVFTRGGSLLTLVDAICKGPGEVAVEVNGGGAFIRNLTVEGYKQAIRRGDTDVAGPRVAEWTAQKVETLFASPPRSLALPIRDTPTVPWDDPKTWANVLKFGPKMMPIFGGKRTMFDVTEAFQKAIDSGATTVYFPRIENPKNDSEKYHLLGTVFVRGNVRRIIGLESEFRDSPDAIEAIKEEAYEASIGKNRAGQIIIENGTAPVVLIERFDAQYGDLNIENRSPRTLSVSSMMTSGIALLPGAGDLFLEDVVTPYLDINGQNVWARQLNMERSFASTVTDPRPNVRQNGGTLWVHGLKTEQNRTKLIVKNGAAEVSAYILANRGSNPLPMFETINSRLSFSVVESVIRKAPFAIAVRETRGTQTRELKHEDVATGTNGKTVSLFVGDMGTGTKAPPAPANLSARAEASRVFLSWQAPAAGEDAAPDGFAIERKDGADWKQINLARADESGATVGGLAPQTAYDFRVVAFNAKGRVASGETTISTLAPPPPGDGTGLRAEYFANKYFDDFKETKTDAGVNFDWSAAPPTGFKSGDFAARWTGAVLPLHSEQYTFSVAGEGTRLWVNDKLLVDGKNGRNTKGAIDLQSGQKVPLKLEFFGQKGANAMLNWQSASQPLEPIPASQLFPGEALPSVTLAASKTKINEGEAATISLKRQGPDTPLDVELAISGDALAGSDYTAIPAKISFAAGQKAIEIPLQILDDKIGEPQKELNVALKIGPTHNVNGPGLTLSVRDNDLPPAANGTGLRAEFFADKALTKSVSKRVDGDVDFNWDKKAPTGGLDTKEYGIRWSGHVQPLFSETYTFSTPSTIYGSVKLWINDQLITNGQNKNGERSGKIDLEAGKKYNLKMEFTNTRFYGAHVKLMWQSPSQFSQVVPKSQLFPTP